MVENKEITLPDILKIFEFESKSSLGKDKKAINDLFNLRILPKGLGYLNWN